MLQILIIKGCHSVGEKRLVNTKGAERERESVGGGHVTYKQQARGW